jgi:hypothetical protein
LAANVTWKHLLEEGRLERHVTSRDEIEDLRGAVARNLRDASLAGLSPDNSFGLAYESALLLGKIVVACAGYRVTGTGGHRTTLVAMTVAMGPRPEIDYFERCRRKRHALSYDAAGVASKSEAAEIRTQVLSFRRLVEAWIHKHRAELS